MNVMLEIYLFLWCVKQTTACTIPSLAQYLHPPLTIVSPKNEEYILINKIKFSWISSKQSEIFGTSVSYKLQVKGPRSNVTLVRDYDTKNNYFIPKKDELSPGPHQVRIATKGIFGFGKWSTVTNFNIVKLLNSHINEQGPEPGSEDKPEVQNLKLKNVSLTQVEVIVIPEILLPHAGDKVEIDKVEFHWKKVPRATSYKLRLKEDNVSSTSPFYFDLKEPLCRECQPDTPGIYVAKVAAIYGDKLGDWGHELRFEVVPQLLEPEILSPLSNDGTHPQGVEFEWTRVEDAKTYELLLTCDNETIRIETAYTFFNMWQFRYIRTPYTAKVAASDSFRTSDWSEKVSFTVSSRSHHNPQSVHRFIFQPVATSWMQKQCADHIPSVQDDDDAQIHRHTVGPITKLNTNAPPVDYWTGVYDRSDDSFYGCLSHAISGDQYHHEATREMVCEEIKRHEHFYLQPGTNYDTYFLRSGANKSDTPPTHIEITAAANALETTIWIFNFRNTLSKWADFQPIYLKYSRSSYSTLNSYMPVYDWPDWP